MTVFPSRVATFLLISLLLIVYNTSKWTRKVKKSTCSQVSLQSSHLSTFFGSSTLACTSHRSRFVGRLIPKVLFYPFIQHRRNYAAEPFVCHMSSSRKRTKPKDLDDKCAADSEPTIQPEPSLALRPTNTRVIQLLKRPRTVVNHSYIDYSLVPFKSEENELPNKIEDMDFHQKLHDILGQSSVRDFVCWLSHGRAFKVSNPAQFETVVCPAYFGHRRYSSFLHQLGIHGYKHLSRGPDRNAFYSQVHTRTHAYS